MTRQDVLVKYTFILTDCNGQPYMHHTVWIPEDLESEVGWAGMFVGPLPLVGTRQEMRIPLHHPDTNAHYAPTLIVVRG